MEHLLQGLHGVDAPGVPPYLPNPNYSPTNPNPNQWVRRYHRISAEALYTFTKKHAR